MPTARPNPSRTPLRTLPTPLPAPAPSLAPAGGDPALVARVRDALEQIRPAVQADGGDVELVGVDGDTASVRFHGACIGCPSSNLTLQHGIERHIVQQVPAVARVIRVD